MFACHRHARELAACLPRQDHVWLTTDASFRFQASTKTNSTKYPKLESTENPCSKCQFCSRDTQPHLHSPSPRGQTCVWTRIGSLRFFVGLCVWWVMLREKRQFRGVLTPRPIGRLKSKFSGKYRLTQVDFWGKFRICGELPLEPMFLEFQTLKLS